MSGNIKLPTVSADKTKTPLPEKKQKSLLKRLEERVQLTGEMNEDGDIPGYCPVHEDVVSSKSPSAQFNPVYGYWYCFAPHEGCAQKGSNANLDKLLRTMPKDGGEKAGNVRDITSAKSSKKKQQPKITQEQAVNYCTVLQTQDGTLQSLEMHRLWDRETIAAMTIGVVDGAYFSAYNNKPHFTIPVYDSHNKYVGCRIYDALKLGPSGNKFGWSGGVGPSEAMIRPPGRKRLAKRVVIMEGEPDAILANQDFRGIKGAPSFVASAHGAGRPWQKSMNHMLADRDVYLLMDNDEAGDEAARKAEKTVKLDSDVKNIYRIKLPERCKDWTDYRKNTVQNVETARKTLLKLIEEAEQLYSRDDAEIERVREETPPDDAQLREVRIADAASIGVEEMGALANINILGRADMSYTIPTEVTLECKRDKGSRCDACPLGEAWEGEAYGRDVLKYAEHSASITEMIAASKEQTTKKYKLDSGAKCGDIEPTVTSKVQAYAYLVEDHVQDDSETREPLQQVMYFIGTGDIAAASVQRVRYQTTNFWKDNSTIFYTWSNTDLGNDLDSFEMPRKTHERLQKMMKGKVRDKLEEIAADYAWNVTSVFGGPRNLLHILADLVYHSVLYIPFENQTAMKGWMDVMVMGDSHTGKSETTRKLAAFYGQGETVNGGSATRAGVLGGMATAVSGSKLMFPKKGALPRNHRGMLTIEESHKLVTRKGDNLIPQMADARDYGEFNLVMTSTMSFNAAARLLWISNPPEGKGRNTLAELPYGAAEAISEMMGGRENVTRLTMAIGVAEDEVPRGEAQPLPKYETRPRFSSKQDTMRQLLLWSWSRTPEKVDWADGAQEKVRQLADKMAQDYSGDFPIAKPQDLYAKLARVAAAIAARVYSTPDGERLVIERKHVKVAAELMKEVYDLDSLGFAKMSRMGIQSEAVQTSHRDELRQELVTRAAFGLCNIIVDSGDFDPNSIGATAGMMQGDVGEIMSLLNRGSFLKQDGRRVRATKQLIDVANEALALMRGRGKNKKAPSARGPKQPAQGTPGTISVK